jgi:hypothetical protein
MIGELLLYLLDRSINDMLLRTSGEDVRGTLPRSTDVRADELDKTGGLVPL